MWSGPPSRPAAGSIWTWITMGLALIGLASLGPWRLGLVCGASMEPTLRPQSLFLYDRGYYQHQPIRAGDVVVLRHAGEVWVKRVYAVGGETFWVVKTIADGVVEHNPIRQDQRERFARAYEVRRRARGLASELRQLRMPRDTVFLVGDGVRSWDSRHFGPIDTAEVLGRVVLPTLARVSGWPAWVEWCFPAARGADRSGNAGRKPEAGRELKVGAGRGSDTAPEGMPREIAF